MCYHVCSPVCLFVYKCICMCVLLCVQIYTYIYKNIYMYIYFAPNVPKVSGLAKSNHYACSISFLLFRSEKKKKKTHPGSQSITTCLLEALVLTASRLGPFCRVSQRGSTAADRRLIDCVTSKMKTSLHLSYFAPGKFRTGPVSSFQISTLCKAPVCLSPISSQPSHPSMIVIKEQMANLDQ